MNARARALAATAALALGCGGETFSLGSNEACDAPRRACARSGYEARSVCVDPRSDRDHCGGCGVRCVDGASCVAGTCCGATLCERCYGSRFVDHRVDVGLETTHMDLVDVDRDGFDDVVLQQLADESLTVVWGHRDGEPDSVIVLPTARPGYGRLHVVDVDGDGHIDVSVGRQHFESDANTGRSTLRFDGITVLFGDGRRGFPRAAQFTTPDEEALTDGRWIDVDNDGDQDLLARSPGIECTTVRINVARPGSVPALDAPKCIEPLPGLRDGYIPLWTEARAPSGRAQFIEYETPTNARGALVRVTLDSTGTAVASRVRLAITPEPDETVIALDADFDGDGLGDMVLEAPPMTPSARSRIGLRIARRTREGSFVRCGSFELLAALDPQGQAGASAFGDFDGDGLVDAVGSASCGYCPSGLHIFLRR